MIAKDEAGACQPKCVFTQGRGQVSPGEIAEWRGDYALTPGNIPDDECSQSGWPPGQSQPDRNQRDQRQ